MIVYWRWHYRGESVRVWKSGDDTFVVLDSHIWLAHIEPLFKKLGIQCMESDDD